MAKPIGKVDSGLFLDRYHEEDGRVHRVREQRGRQQILDSNARLRREPEALRNPDGMRWALQIPDDDLDLLVRANPDLASNDRQIHHEAWKRFMASDVSIPYRVYEASGRGRTR
jgi:hypothetical protein